MSPAVAGARVAVLVAAREARRLWLEQCLASIRAQAGPAVEVRLGVDGCEATSRLLREMGEGHWWSRENVGPYVIRNSLAVSPPPVPIASLAPAGEGVAAPTHYAAFDVDDRMLPGYLLELVKLAGTDAVAGAKRLNVGRFAGRGQFRTGVCVIPAAVWARLGGYRPWRFAADMDLTVRARALGVRIRRYDQKPLYVRRVHPGSLTVREPAGSDARLARIAEAQALVERGDLDAGWERVPLEWRDP